MDLGAGGIVVNQTGELLVIKRDDTRTWSIPAGGLEAGEGPDDACMREVEEETGLKVMPVRLVSLAFRPEIGADGNLLFVFRCLQRGGAIKRSAESIQVGFTPTNPIQVNIIALTKQMTIEALKHSGGNPDWGTYYLNRRERVLLQLLKKVVYPYKNAKRKLLTKQDYVPPTPWTVGAFVILQNAEGDVLWVQRTDNGKWNLPGGRVESKEAPWNAAVREAKEETGLDVRLIALTGVYTKSATQDMVLQFTGEVLGGQLTKGLESAEFRYVKSGEEQDDFAPLHILRVADALDPDRTNPIVTYQEPHPSQGKNT